jgi:hypothetical protein
MVALVPVLGGAALGDSEGDPAAVHPLAEEAARRLAPWWPAVGEAISAA